MHREVMFLKKNCVLGGWDRRITSSRLAWALKWDTVSKTECWKFKNMYIYIHIYVYVYMYLCVYMYIYIYLSVVCCLLGCISRYSAGSVYYYPSYHHQHNPVQVQKLQKELQRYLTRKTGFKAVIRIRCTKGGNTFSFFPT
jgi:hypothetical protein